MENSGESENAHISALAPRAAISDLENNLSTSMALLNVFVCLPAHVTQSFKQQQPSHSLPALLIEQHSPSNKTSSAISLPALFKEQQSPSNNTSRGTRFLLYYQSKATAGNLA
jgi:hypothetical protein